jgi:hypothetical protein
VALKTSAKPIVKKAQGNKKTDAQGQKSQPRAFSVVGMSASAGGLEAF